MRAATIADLGRPRDWARDFALLGAISCALIPSVCTAGLVPSRWVWTFCLAAVVVGAGLGAIVGLASRALAGRVANAWPVGLLLVLGPLLGLAWGAVVGSSAGYVLWDRAGLPWDSTLVMRDAAIGSGLAAAIQFGWFWLPYTLGRARRRDVRRLWLAAIVTSVALGAIARNFVIAQPG